MLLYREVAVFKSPFCNIYRQLVFFTEGRQAGNVINVFMRDKNGFYLFHLQSGVLHSSFGFSQAKAGINQHRFAAVANIVAIGIAS